MTPVYVLSVGSYTEDDKKAWMAAAFEALNHVPLDILKTGAKAASLKCSHPAKIVPTIMDAIADPLRWRLEADRSEARRLTHKDPPKYLPGPLERELLDRMQNAGEDTLLASVRRMGITLKSIYQGEDGRLHNSIAAGG